MSTITINRNPPMTHYLVQQAGAFRNDPVTIVDVGARWGFNSEWAAFGEDVRIYCFEPDEDECHRLNVSAPFGVKYLPYALGRTAGNVAFYENRISASSGIYKTNMDYFSRLLNRDNGVVVRESVIEVHTLDDVLGELGVASVDFIKLDVEGAEVDVLAGGENYLKSGNLIGVLSEVRFQQEINGSPTFSALDQFLQPYGLRLFDLQFYHQSRHVLPYPGLKDYRTEEGERFFAYTTQGQIMDGDALYLRDLLISANEERRATATISQLLKTAAFFEIYSCNDCAAELITEHRSALEKEVDCDRLLELLTPTLSGVPAGYSEYVRQYFDPHGGILRNTNDPKNSREQEAELKRLATQLDAVYASTSWRVTEPLRKLGILLKRLRTHVRT